MAQTRAEQTGGYDASLFFLLGRDMLGVLPILVLPRGPRVDQATQDKSPGHRSTTQRRTIGPRTGASTAHHL
ncbi:hypothetical protein [Streptomyces griseorubiginosus]|uniref:Uncharacterized protein n=1 Tax=Streptomyces griseorubiginosus TaxID=67304 RepID=A0AAI8KRH5_9ACTN|nr:hypothetical protein [Streptomyces griseorubiginosus]AYC35904.1 hypothetical protein DWG14_00112 [Streptomyces griseorubiginosus]